MTPPDHAEVGLSFHYLLSAILLEVPEYSFFFFALSPRSQLYVTL